jgi:hypothetical protein
VVDFDQQLDAFRARLMAVKVGLQAVGDRRAGGAECAARVESGLPCKVSRAVGAKVAVSQLIKHAPLTVQGLRFGAAHLILIAGAHGFG